MAIQERLILAIPAGPEEQEDGPRHSTGSKLSVPTHNFLRKGCGFNYDLGGEYYAHVTGQPIELAEFKGSDIPTIVAAGGRIKLAIVGLDHTLNLPDGLLRQVKVLRQLGFGRCEFRLGVPMGEGYPGEDGEDTKLEDVAGLRVATALPVLAQKKFNERGIRVNIVPMDGHVENAIRYGHADVIVDITETGGTMRRNRLTPAESIESFQAVLIGNRSWLRDLSQDAGRERMLNRLLSRVDRALRNPNAWLNLEGAHNNADSIFTNVPDGQAAIDVQFPQAMAS